MQKASDKHPERIDSSQGAAGYPRRMAAHRIILNKPRLIDRASQAGEREPLMHSTRCSVTAWRRSPGMRLTWAHSGTDSIQCRDSAARWLTPRRYVQHTSLTALLEGADGELPPSKQPRDVAFWHQADLLRPHADVWLWGQTGQYLLGVSLRLLTQNRHVWAERFLAGPERQLA